jgi:hypothetical protein
LLIAITDDRIDFAGMSAESGKRLNELMHKPEVQEQFGIGPLRDRFDPKHCERVYDALGHFLQTAGTFFLRLPPTASAQFLFTDDEKKELGPPTAAALDEFAPKWLRENQAVAALCVVLGSILNNKLQAATVEARRVRAELVNAAAGVPPGMQPGPVPVPPGNGQAQNSPPSKPPAKVVVVSAPASDAPPSFGGTGGGRVGG